MDIHINKKIAGIALASLIIGGGVGGAIGFAAGSEEGRGGHGRFEMNDRSEGNRNSANMDNRADGEMNDDKGGTPNQDEMSASGTPFTATTSVTAQ